MSIFGAHLLIWSSQLDEDSLKFLPRIKEMGFDGVEIPLTNPMEIGPQLVEKTRKELEKLGLECAGCAGMGASENLIDDDRSIREKGRTYLRKFIDLSADLGADVLDGVLYGTFEMSKGRARTKEEWDRAVKELKEAADYAKEKNVTLCLEVINRYETYFLNTARDGVQLAKDIGKDNVKVHLDTYHMNIEEKDFYNPIVECGEYLGYMHCCENDRGIPGTGHVNWDEVFTGLTEVDYDGWLTIESFYGPMKEMPVATSVWRELADSIDDIPREGVKFLRKKMEEYGT